MAHSVIFLALERVESVDNGLYEEVHTFITYFSNLIIDFWSALPHFSLFIVFVCACIVYWCASAVQSLMGV